MKPFEQLEQLIRELNPVQITLLLEMARAMRRDIQEDINEQSDLLVPEFATNFSNRLLIHHATHAEKFSKKAFEYAFASASTSAGRTAQIISSSTNPGTDVLVNGGAFITAHGLFQLSDKRWSRCRQFKIRLLFWCCLNVSQCQMSVRQYD